MIDVIEQIKGLLKFWITADFFAVGLFAFGGVAIRVGIQNVLDGKVEEDPVHNYGPFMQMFHAHTYLLCNMVGCFIMSFCIAHTAQISSKSTHLYKGLTTGFCGSLTTFSSWMTGCVNILWDRYWYKYLLTILIEFWLTWAAFTMGYACAKIVDNAWEQASWYACKMTITSAIGMTRAEASPISEDAVASLDQQPEQESPHAIELAQIPHHDTKDKSDRELSGLDREREGQLDRYESIEDGNSMDTIRKRTNITNNRDNNTTDTNNNRELEGEEHTHWILQYEYYIWGVLLCVTCATVWIILGLLPHIHYYNTIKLRNTYRAIALAPLGAWTRWGLTRFPGIKNMWPEMHPQTMIANLAGVLCMCALVVYSTSSWVYAIDAGFNGSLTTVSTFFAELHALYLEKGPLTALRYCLTTFSLAIAIIQILRAGHSS